ncbi:hypothetical protein QTA57_02280 [Fontisubflavum oceani]|uniref:hypothetical protein n=1 Tax=Fontisubflavum oceani TaxID=2978973 RepID=UPI0025B3B6B2|nr:hypothetical protein [Fontisubflavum oceani]WJY22028.1 hypothetical protein QTA57_02280 [Fontisubflavum oceani]
MSRRWIAYWVLVTVTLAVHLTMELWTLPKISCEAGGLVAFDLRPLGYDLAEAEAFLSALSEDGRALYLGLQHWLDRIFPLLLALVLGLPIWALSAGWPRSLRLTGVALAGLGMAFDYAENARVAGLLRGRAEDVTEAAVAAASLATQLTSVMTSGAMMLLLVLLLRRRAKVIRARTHR